MTHPPPALKLEADEVRSQALSLAVKKGARTETASATYFSPS
ncbi:hypothetical protein ABE444_07420 [Brevundimonas pondensis]